MYSSFSPEPSGETSPLKEIIVLKPLTNAELTELDELLAQLDEKNIAMDASEADGFMTAVLLLPNEVLPKDWMPCIFSADPLHAHLLSPKKQNRLEELLYRRYLDIDHTLSQGDALDPIVFDPEDDEGNLLQGEESIVALQPFALGFLAAAQTWNGLIDTDNEKIASALVGIWRHLPEEALGDFREIQQTLLSESPLEDLDDAIKDLALSVAEIASVTRGFKSKLEKIHSQAKTKSTIKNNPKA